MFTDITQWINPVGLFARFWAIAIFMTMFHGPIPPVQAAFQLPEGEKITNPIVIGRGIPQKEAYEPFDPKIGRNFDIRNLWIRADIRVRPEFRNNVCFGGGIGLAGQCNAPGLVPNNIQGQANDQYIQQMTRLGIGYDLSPDVNFYFELIDSRTWGGNGTPVGPSGAGNNGDPAIHTCGNTSPTGRSTCTLGIRAGYMLIRNFAGVQGLGVKAGRQYIVFGDQSLFGHFDWANTGWSFDGVMLQYGTSIMDTHLGFFRTAETDLLQGAALGSGGPNIAGTGQARNGAGDADFLIFYNQIKSVPWVLIEPYYVYYKNNLGAGDISSQGLGTPKHGDQTRHVIGNRLALKKDYFDASSEVVYQFGQMGDTAPGASGLCGNPGGEGKCLHINAWATRNWIGFTAFNLPGKPRIAFNFDYASGDGRANCTLNSAFGSCRTANTFENFFPTNHIHMGYMDVMGWKNMMSFSGNFQARLSKDDHVELWYTNLHLANARDNWYRASQGVYVFSRPDNTVTHIADEVDFVWTHFFMNGMVAFQGGYGHLFPGPYISHNLGRHATGQDWGYAQLWINY